MVSLKEKSVAGSLLLVMVILNALVLQSAYTSGNSSLYGWLFITLPLLFFALYRMRQPKIKQMGRKRMVRRGYCWFRLLRSRPRHYFIGMPSQEYELKGPGKTAIVPPSRKKRTKQALVKRYKPKKV